MQYFLLMLYLILNPANYCDTTSGHQCHSVTTLHLLYNYNLVTPALYHSAVNVVFDGEQLQMQGNTRSKY